MELDQTPVNLSDMNPPRKRGRPKSQYSPGVTLRPKSAKNSGSAPSGGNGRFPHADIPPEELVFQDEPTPAREPVTPEKKEPKPKQKPKLEKKIEEAYFSVAAVVSLANITDAQIIATSAPNIAHAWYVYCQDHPEFKEWLEEMLRHSSLGVLIGVHVSLSVQIMQAHGKAPQDIGASIKSWVQKRFAARTHQNTQRATQFGIVTPRSD